MVIQALKRKVMESTSRRFSTVTQVNPDTLEDMTKRNGLDPIAEGDTSNGDYRRKSTFGHLALYKGEEEGPPASFISAYTTPGPKERATSEIKKANLGVMLGVYLPTIQHILGVTMFIRLFWVVGIAGLYNTMLLLALCCLCTLLTSISLSAVATNGVVESGGAYFIISRNLGVEFGSAVGILFYLANTVAASMYLVGGVEVLLMYIAPDMAIGGKEALHNTDPFGSLYNNYRIYGTLFLILQVLIVAMGVKFVQLMAPVSLACVIVALLACFAGGVEKAITGEGRMVCSLDDRLIQSTVLFDNHNNSLLNETSRTRWDGICDVCDKNPALTHIFCEKHSESCVEFTKVKISCTQGFTGFNMNTLNDNLWPMYMVKDEVMPGKEGKADVEVVQDVTATFFVLLAIYFPAVTGIMTGTNMSGDLKDPQRSIPSGTIAATVTTSLIYYALAILFAASVDRSVLRDKFGRSIENNMVVSTLAWPSPWIVTVGAFLSTFGAALQCLCNDVIPILAPFATVTKKNEPFLGLLLTTVIAEMAILLGAVDKIAEVLDFFFLMCYAFVNIIAFLHSVLRAPNWRPRFKYFHWSLSLLGAFLCFFIMFGSDWHLALVACALTLAIYKYVEWKGAKKEWGDGMRGLALTTAQYSLLKVEDKDPHPKNWRPQLLIALSAHWGNHIIDKRALSMLNLAAQMKAGRGLTIACAFVKGSANAAEERTRSGSIKQRLLKDMATSRLRGFAKTLFYQESQIYGCVSGVFQSVGIGGLRPNTVLINWPDIKDMDEVSLFAEKMITGVHHEYCILLAKGITEFPETTDRLTGFIDIWWVVQDGGILMLIAYLLKQHKVWRGCLLRIFAVGGSDKKRNEDMKQALQKHIYMLRIDAEVFIVSLLDQEVTEEIYEKTAELEKRQKTLVQNEMKRLKQRESAGYVNEAFVDENKTKLHTSNSSKSFSKTPTVISINEEETSFSSSEEGAMSQLYGSSPSIEETTGAELKLNVHKMNTSFHLNKVIRENSPDSQLILLNLPNPTKNRINFVHSYMSYLDVLTEGLKRVLFIGGSGKEVITADS
ncbi:unnamed protein product [Auanema sp. JU1783]|nr:unnamed protein product [Auanema sp. JU1783]